MIVRPGDEIVNELPPDSVKIEEIRKYRVDKLYYSHMEKSFYLWDSEINLGRKLEKSKDSGIRVYSKDCKHAIRIPYKRWIKQWEKDHPSIEEVQNKV